MNSLQQQIESDLAWREAEMASLKLLLASAPAGSDRQRALLRANCAMLYAHYEGFCKFCWMLMLDKIKAESHKREDLADPLARWSMVSVFKTLRGNLSDENLWDFACSDYHKQMKLLADFPNEVDTESNLWPRVSSEINKNLGLMCPMLASHEVELRQLVGRRNGIAHGEKLEIASIQQFQTFEHAAMLVMHELAIAIVENIEAKCYLRPTVDPAASI